MSPAASVSGCSGTSFAPPLHAPRGERPPLLRPCTALVEAAAPASLGIAPPLPPTLKRAQTDQVRATASPAGPPKLQRAQSEAAVAGAPTGEAGQTCCQNPSMSPPPSPSCPRMVAASPPRRRGAASSAAAGVSSQKRAAAARARNPFIEYDVREKRLIKERKWLQEDSTYLAGRTEELRYSTMLKNMNIESESKQDLYEKRTYYGPYSVKLKNQKQRAASAGRQRPVSAAEAGRQRPAAPAGEDRGSHASYVKKMAQELKNSSSDEFQKSFIKSLSGLEKDLFIQRLSQWEIDLLKSRGISFEDSPREKTEPLQDMRALFSIRNSLSS